MMSTILLDRIALDFARQKVLGDGSIVFPAILGKAGIQEYFDPSTGGMRRELRPIEEVSKPSSLESFSLLAFTNEHPSEGQVTVDNYKRLTIGTLGESIVFDEKTLTVLGNVCVKDRAALEDIKNGKRQVSLGYLRKIIREPGMWTNPLTNEIEEFDSFQVDIKGNHGALVQNGRAEIAELTVDSKNRGNSIYFFNKDFNMSAIQNLKGVTPKTALDEEMEEMVDIELSGQSFKVPKSLAVVIAMLKEQAGMNSSPAVSPTASVPTGEVDQSPNSEEKKEETNTATDQDPAKEKEMAGDSAEVVALRAERDALKAKVAAMSKAVANDSFDKAVAARIKLVNDAGIVLKAHGKSINGLASFKSNEAIYKAVVSEVAQDSASEDSLTYNKAYFDILLKEASKEATSASAVTEPSHSEDLVQDTRDKQPKKRRGMGPLSVSKEVQTIVTKR